MQLIQICDVTRKLYVNSTIMLNLFNTKIAKMCQSNLTLTLLYYQKRFREISYVQNTNFDDCNSLMILTGTSTVLLKLKLNIRHVGKSLITYFINIDINLILVIKSNAYVVLIINTSISIPSYGISFNLAKLIFELI